MRHHKKLTAVFFLLLHGASVFYPGVAHALTNGPSQPEASQFQPASITNLVDPFSGDFSYNIPLLDVDGYPVNLAYSSGGSMDDEASWVGFGWNINPGSVSRVMKGLPDEFNGKDSILKEYNVRPDITGGVTFNISGEIFGFDVSGASPSVDIFYNNQKGLGVEIGAGVSASLSTAKHVSGSYTGGLTAGGSLGIKANSQTGADFNFGLRFGGELKNKEDKAGALGLSFGGGLNSRAGLKSTTMGFSFNTSKKEATFKDHLAQAAARFAGDLLAPLGMSDTRSSSSMPLGSFTTSYGQAFNPSITMPMRNESYSISPQTGFHFWGLQAPTVQLTGHYTKQQLAQHAKAFPAYGFLNSNKARTDKNALMDVNREKDVPYMESTPTLAVPYVTTDLFSVTSHLGSSQFKAFSNSSGVFFDPVEQNTSDALSLGVEFGGGAGVKGGGDLAGNGSSTVTRKWILNNDFLPYGDFGSTTATDGEDSYFKLVGEKSGINKNFFNRIAGSEPVQVKTDDVDDQAKAFPVLAAHNQEYPVSARIARNKREPRAEVFTPLNANQAQSFALDRKLKSYLPLDTTSSFGCSSGVFGQFTEISRTAGNHKPHHFSEISVLKADGMRLHYGIPVYNNAQTDVTFSVGRKPNSNNLVTYNSTENSTGNESGMEYYFSRETVPAYATSFLLSGICSPDYLDLTGNGISDDDRGTAVKFNYSRVNSQYRWRTPVASGISGAYANFSEGNKSTPDDDKASFSYGSKELWYMHSIESKNMVAIFRLSDREDGYGYYPDGSRDLTSKQKRLDRIELYTKSELLSNPSSPVPVKVVHFEYDYSLFPGVPNNVNSGGKLTLKSVYFTYGRSNSGADNRYYFTYEGSGSFKYQQYDRWGNYKSAGQNATVAGVQLGNNDFPYTPQNKAVADSNAALWQLKEIELPAGGKIKVTYESDDYAYVQNKRAMQMAKIVGYGSNGNYTGYQQTDKIYIQLPGSSSDSTVDRDYFQGIDYLYYKTMIDLGNQGKDTELVSGWAQVKRPIHVVSGNIAEVQLEKRGGYHPVAAAGWQYLRANLPKVAYDYEVDETLGPLAFVLALIKAIRTISELTTPFEETAMMSHFGEKIIPNKGYARICNFYRKFGGGSRVKKIIMDDRWGEMAGSGNGVTTTTGMAFDYTQEQLLPNGSTGTISSGVASYEPMTGSEENPFKQPIVYQQSVHLTSNVFTVDEPLGESYFPAPSVGYSQVKITSLDATGAPVTNGHTLKRFYTAKDFPTIARRTDLSRNKYNQSSIFGLFNIDNGNSVVLSQGFYIENNDMHGKPRSEETFDGSGKMLAGTYYHYRSSGTEELRLDNNALTLQPDGTVKTEEIGEEFELFHDMREQVTDNTGINVNLNLDVLYFAILVVPIPTCIPIVETSYCGYQSASTVKVVNKYGIIDRVVTIENGSTMTSQNLLWDPLTGQVLLTRTQNGFDDPVYNFSLPAYYCNEEVQWTESLTRTASYEKGMGGAYRNAGLLLPGVSVAAGVVPTGLQPYLVPGDELGLSGSYTRLWVTEVPGTSGPELRLINQDGSLFNGTGDLLVLRSGRRNILAAPGYSVVSLKSPIRNGKIDLGSYSSVLSTSAATYSDEWSADPRTVVCNPLPFPSSLDCEDPCTSEKPWRITRTAGSNPNEWCVSVQYYCDATFPDHTAVRFVFVRTVQYGSLPVQQIESVVIDKDHLTAGFCYTKEPGAMDDFRKITQGCESAGCCTNPVDLRLNPYYSGLKGDWRGKESYVYMTGREAVTGTPYNGAQQPTDIRHSGGFTQYSPFYVLDGGQFTRLLVPSPADPNWIASATVTRVNGKGQEIENKDALDRHSSAQFGFNDLVATAVASNARNHEMAYDGFEDYAFGSSCLVNPGDTCYEGGHFSFRTPVRRSTDSNLVLTQATAHTGRYSLRVKANVQAAVLQTGVLTSVAAQPKYAFNSSKEMVLKKGGLVEPFKPLASRKYVISGWIKGNVANSSDTGDATKAKIIAEVTSASNTSIHYKLNVVRSGPKVEGWTRVLGVLDLPGSFASVTDLSLQLKLYPGSQAAYFDDVRVHPYDGNMKSFAYDYRTLRLMAELDENNYATFFEYSDEGQLLRNKKETEKGIVTLKETRSLVRKNVHP